MDRRKPGTTTNEIDLYTRTYYSILRSSGEVRVSAFEEAHAYSNSSLHASARAPEPDVAAFGYAAARLPEAMHDLDRVVLGQSDDVFESFGFPVKSWDVLRTRGRRRLLRHDGRGTLAAYIASTSDIDDIVPIVTAFQIEWNKMHALMSSVPLEELDSPEALEQALSLDAANVLRLREALGSDPKAALSALQAKKLDLRLRLLSGSFSEYQEAAQIWWQGVTAFSQRPTRQTPTYFVSSNPHALGNLLGGYALAHADRLAEDAQIFDELEDAHAPNALYHLLRGRLDANPAVREELAAWNAESGIRWVENQTHVEVEAEIIELARIRPERLDPRIVVPGIERLADSDARILNIDYPLGMAAYHILSRVGQGLGSPLGIYIMGKAATLNGQVGDVLIPRVVHDEHTQNTFLVPNAFAAESIDPYLEAGNVLDNQKAVTCRGPFLQNQAYMSVFYREGYTVLEMEAGPYLCALYEMIDPRRHPRDEIVSFSGRIPFELGMLHYASDTPYSRRQRLISESLGVAGLDSTYACAVAIARRILESEVARVSR